MGLAKPGEICGLTGTAPVLDLQEAAGLVFEGSGTEPNRFSNPNPDCWRVTRTHC